MHIGGLLAAFVSVVFCMYPPTEVDAAIWNQLTDGLSVKDPMPLPWESGTFATWRQCHQQCNATAGCLMFAWDKQNEKCQLHQTAFTHGVLKHAKPYTVGQIDVQRNHSDLAEPNTGDLLWLGVGAPKLASAALLRVLNDSYTPTLCRQLCDENQWLIPCVTAHSELRYYGGVMQSWCSLGSGFVTNLTFMDTDTDHFDVFTKDTPETDPTGFGTKIPASNLATAPPPLNGSDPPYSMLATGLPLAGHLRNISLSNVTDFECAKACHADPTCASFCVDIDKFIDGVFNGFCMLYDYAVKGIIFNKHEHYGIIDRTRPPGSIESMVPSRCPPKMTPTSVTAGVTTEADCATICYETYEPYYCTMFRLAAPKCYTYSIDFVNFTAASIAFNSADPSHFGRIEDGRRAFDPAHDNGNPNLQMGPLPTTTSTTTPAPIVPYQRPKTQVFSNDPGKTVGSATPRATMHKASSLGCTMACHRAMWDCRARDWDKVTGECRLFEAADALSDDATSDYAVVWKR